MSYCLGELDEVSEEVTSDLDFELYTRTETAELGSWNLISPVLRFSLQKLLVFMSTERGWKPKDKLETLPSYNEEKENWKAFRMSEHSAWADGAYQGEKKGRAQGLTPPFWLGGIHRFTSCWWLPVCLWVGNQLSRMPVRYNRRHTAHLAQLNILKMRHASHANLTATTTVIHILK